MLSFIGGTGPEGRGLALRLALAGEEVIIGSRDAARAQEAAQRILERAPGATVRGVGNPQAAQEADVVFITVPYGGHRSTLELLGDALRGKVVVDVVAPVEFVDGRPRAIPVEEGSAAQQAQLLLPRSLVVAAFHNLSARDLLNPERVIDGDVVVCSDHPEPKAQIMALAEKISGVRAVDGGGLEFARYVEEFIALQLSINRIYKGRSMFRITGVRGLKAVS